MIPFVLLELPIWIFRSFEQNFEVNALIYDKEVTMNMKRQFAVFQNNSKQLTLKNIQPDLI